MNTRIIGEKGERIAERALRKAGGRVLTRNYRTKTGEIDLVVRFGDVIAFVEVKTRSGIEHGAPSEAVDKRKQRRIAKAAMQYLKEYPELHRRLRFDVVEVLTDEVRHIPNAFWVYDSKYC